VSSSSRSRIAAFILLAGTFLVGLVAGVTLDRWAVRRASPGPPPVPFAAERILHRLDRNLDLSEPQREQVRQILERRRASLDDIRREMRPRIEAERRATAAEIERVLTPEQVREFRRIRDRGGPGAGEPGRPRWRKGDGRAERRAAPGAEVVPTVDTGGDSQ
jgi:hypothetical protein